MAPVDFSIPEDLQIRLSEHKVVPFVGAGVSVPVRDRESGQALFPSWQELMEKAVQRLKTAKRPNDAGFVSFGLKVDNPDFLAMAHHARKALGGPAWSEFLKEELDPGFEAVQQDSLELARAVWALRSRLVITTNYDKVLRWASPDKDDLETWDIESKAEQAASLRSAVRKPTVWHLHGRIENVAQLILATDDYRLLYPEDDAVQDSYSAARKTLRTHSLTSTFLFVGFSFADRQLVAEIDGQQGLFAGYGGPHYALVHQDEAERIKQLDLDWLELLTFDSFDDLPRHLRQLGELVPDDESSIDAIGAQSARPQPSDDPPAAPIDPAEARGVYGRRDDIRKLVKQVRSTRLLAVFGLTGIGKSVLISEVRRELARPSISLRASAQMELSQLYGQVAIMLGDTSEDPQPPTTGGMFGTSLFEQQVQKAPPGLLHVEQAQLLFDGGKFHDPEIGEFFGLLARCAPETCVILECREEPAAGALPA